MCKKTSWAEQRQQTTSHAPMKKGLQTNEKLWQALTAVDEGKSMEKVAKEFKISYSTSR